MEKPLDINKVQFICDLLETRASLSSVTDHGGNSTPSNGVFDCQLALEKQEHYWLGQRMDGEWIDQYHHRWGQGRRSRLDRPSYRRGWGYRAWSTQVKVSEHFPSVNLFPSHHFRRHSNQFHSIFITSSSLTDALTDMTSPIYTDWLPFLIANWLWGGRAKVAMALRPRGYWRFPKCRTKLSATICRILWWVSLVFEPPPIPSDNIDLVPVQLDPFYSCFARSERCLCSRPKPTACSDWNQVCHLPICDHRYPWKRLDQRWSKPNRYSCTHWHPA